jgi:hypothetical protein
LAGNNGDSPNQPARMGNMRFRWQRFTIEE